MVMNDRILRRVAKVPHAKTRNAVLDRQNPFCKAVNFACIRALLIMLHEIENTRTVVASIP